MTKQEALKALSCIANSWGTGCEEKVDAHNTISRLINSHFWMVEKVKRVKVVSRPIIVQLISFAVEDPNYILIERKDIVELEKATEGL